MVVISQHDCFSLRSLLIYYGVLKLGFYVVFIVCLSLRVMLLQSFLVVVFLSLRLMCLCAEPTRLRICTFRNSPVTCIETLNGEKVTSKNTHVMLAFKMELNVYL